MSPGNGQERPPVDADLDRLTGTRNIRLDDLIERESLKEVIQSFVSLFGISVRVRSADGDMLADAVEQQHVCRLVNEVPEGRAACAATVGEVKAITPGVDDHVVHRCFSGACYRVSSLTYDGRCVGRIILGPYLPAETRELPGSLRERVPSVDHAKLQAALPRMPRARAETVASIAEHMRSVLDLILFSGHKSLLTSQMHLASVRESYKQLQDNNARLQDAYDRLKELDRLKSNFIATVSHELRTPLTSIIGYSEMLDEGIAGPLQHEQAEFIRTIREKGEQLLALIMSLLDLSKLESGTMSLLKSNVDVRQTLDDVLTILRPSATKRGIGLAVHIDGSIPPLRGDVNRIRQVVLNLTENALKFTAPGGQVTLHAAVALQPMLEDPDGGIGFALIAPSRTVLELRIADTGIGIPPHEREKIFDPFYQVDSSSTREYGGTGLGLAIVRRLVEAHDGTVRVEHNEPCGSVFVVSLPLPQPG